MEAAAGEPLMGSMGPVSRRDPSATSTTSSHGLLGDDGHRAGGGRAGQPGGIPEEVDHGHLGAQVAAVAGVPVRVADEPLPTDDPMQRMPDVTLAGRGTRVVGRDPLDKGLEQR